MIGKTQKIENRRADNGCYTKMEYYEVKLRIVKCEYLVFLKNCPSHGLFAIFVLFKSKFYNKNFRLGGIQSLIIGEKGKHADPLTTTIPGLLLKTILLAQRCLLQAH